MSLWKQGQRQRRAVCGGDGGIGDEERKGQKAGQRIKKKKKLERVTNLSYSPVKTTSVEVSSFIFPFL